MGISLSSPAELFSETNNDSVQTLRNQFEQALQVALTAAVVSADPEIIVLGGGIASSLQGSLGRLTQGLKKTFGHSPELRIAELGDLSGALGAAVDAHHRIVSAMGVPLDAMHRLPRR
jgi:predicted NBD/HSP70 family sugar kinase